MTKNKDNLTPIDVSRNINWLQLFQKQTEYANSISTEVKNPTGLQSPSQTDGTQETPKAVIVSDLKDGELEEHKNVGEIQQWISEELTPLYNAVMESKMKGGAKSSKVQLHEFLVKKLEQIEVHKRIGSADLYDSRFKSEESAKLHEKTKSHGDVFL